jgi:hypothetical protein
VDGVLLRELHVSGVDAMTLTSIAVWERGQGNDKQTILFIVDAWNSCIWGITERGEPRTRWDISALDDYMSLEGPFALALEGDELFMYDSGGNAGMIYIFDCVTGECTGRWFGGGNGTSFTVYCGQVFLEDVDGVSVFNRYGHRRPTHIGIANDVVRGMGAGAGELYVSDRVASVVRVFI